MELKIVLQITSLILTILTSLFLLLLSYEKKTKDYMLWPPFLYCLHLIIFYIFILFADIKFDTMVWSALVRVHGVVTILGISVITYLEKKNA